MLTENGPSSDVTGGRTVIFGRTPEVVPRPIRCLRCNWRFNLREIVREAVVCVGGRGRGERREVVYICASMCIYMCVCVLVNHDVKSR